MLEAEKRGALLGPPWGESSVDAQGRQIVRCPKGRHWLAIEVCDARQRRFWNAVAEGAKARGHCRNCGVRFGGPDDPRTTGKG